MADVTLDYGQINGVATRLTTEGGDIKTTLIGLQTAVTNLLTGSGGLWLQQSSPAMSAQYTEFNASLTAAIDNLGKFAESFQTIARNVSDLDTSLSGSGSQ